MDEWPRDAGDRLWAQEPRLRLLLMHLAGRAILARVEVEDLVQEVFLRALQAPNGLPPPEPGEGALWALLRRIARNAVVDVARAIRAAKRDGRHEALARSDWSRAGLRASQLPGRDPGPSTVAAAAEHQRSLAEAFRSLSGEHRRVLGLRQLQGLTAAETGLRMGRSESAVHSLYRRALLAWEQAAGERG